MPGPIDMAAGYARTRFGRRDRPADRGAPGSGGRPRGAPGRAAPGRLWRPAAAPRVFVCGTCFAPGTRIASLALVVDGDGPARHGPRHAAAGPAARHRRRPRATAAASGVWPAPSAAPVQLALRAAAGGRPRAHGAAGEHPCRDATPSGAAPRRAHRRRSRSAWRPTSRRPSCSAARSSRSARRRSPTGSASSATTARSRTRSPRCRRRSAATSASCSRARTAGSASTRTSSARCRSRPPAPATSRMADQDDDWHPDKLETLVGAIGDAKLVYSDQRIIAEDGALLAETYWGSRGNNHTSLLSLLVANAVTGAASLFPRALLDDALPFPPAQFAHFHDHWIGAHRARLGDIAFVDRPLYDYVQHGGATLGHANANRMPGLRDRLTPPRRGPRERIRLWRMHYFVDVCRLLQFAAVLQLRCGDRMSAAQAAGARALRAAPTRSARRAAGLAAARRARARRAGGRRRSAPSGCSPTRFVWRRAAGRRARATRRSAACGSTPCRRRRSTRKPGARGAGRPGAARGRREDRAAARSRSPTTRPPRVNILIPTIDLQHFFGGYIAKLNLARRLAERGHARADRHRRPGRAAAARLAARSSSPTAALAGSSTASRSRSGASRPASRSAATTRSSPRTWWTAHIAHARAATGGALPVPDPGVRAVHVPDGQLRRAGRRVLPLPARRAVLDRAAARLLPPPRGSASTPAGRWPATARRPRSRTRSRRSTPRRRDLAGRRPRRLLFYARPEPHAARNMFELGVLALGRALERGAFAGGWELHGIGTVRVAPPDRPRRRRVPRAAPARGPGRLREVLREHDVGLALMYTPHPSLVPIEMASAGMLTVTNSFENKTAEAMAAISPNLVAAAPSDRGRRRGAVRGRGRRRGRRAARARQPRGLEPRLGRVVRRRAAGPRDRLPGGLSGGDRRPGERAVARRRAASGQPAVPALRLAPRDRRPRSRRLPRLPRLGRARRPRRRRRRRRARRAQAPILFFAISGFLLYRPWVAAPRPAPRRYARRRALRILPAYWLALTLLAIFPGIVGVFTGDWWRYYLFLQLYSADTAQPGHPGRVDAVRGGELLPRAAAVGADVRQARRCACPARRPRRRWRWPARPCRSRRCG